MDIAHRIADVYFLQFQHTFIDMYVFQLNLVCRQWAILFSLDYGFLNYILVFCMKGRDTDWEIGNLNIIFEW
jgi:hypothetical protein